MLQFGLCRAQDDVVRQQCHCAVSLRRADRQAVSHQCRHHFPIRHDPEIIPRAGAGRVDRVGADRTGDTVKHRGLITVSERLPVRPVLRAEFRETVIGTRGFIVIAAVPVKRQRIHSSGQHEGRLGHHELRIFQQRDMGIILRFVADLPHKILLMAPGTLFLDAEILLHQRAEILVIIESRAGTNAHFMMIRPGQGFHQRKVIRPGMPPVGVNRLDT